MKIALLLPNWLGDLVMATPTLRALHKHFGSQAHITGIMRPYLAETLGGTPWLDEQWYFDPRAKDAQVRMRAIVGRMRQARFDVAVLFPNSFRTGLMAFLAGARERVGYVRYGRGPLLTTRLYPERRGRHLVPQPTVDTYLGLAEALGCPPESPRLELATTAVEENIAERVWHNLGLRDDGRVIALNSSGAFGAAKLWPTEHFAALAQQIVDGLDHDVLVVCGPDERQTARSIVRMAGRRRVFTLADQPLGLAVAKACIRRTRLMVSTDSGPRHMAAAFDKPVVTVFGPILPVFSENPTQRAENLILDLPCIGCRKRVCPLGHHRCMQELPVDAVFAAVERLSEETVAAPSFVSAETLASHVPLG